MVGRKPAVQTDSERLQRLLDSYIPATYDDHPILVDLVSAVLPLIEAWLAEKNAAARKYRVRIDILALILGAIGVAIGVAALALTVWWHSPR